LPPGYPIFFALHEYPRDGCVQVIEGFFTLLMFFFRSCSRLEWSICLSLAVVGRAMPNDPLRRHRGKPGCKAIDMPIVSSAAASQDFQAEFPVQAGNLSAEHVGILFH
jgi:hypothetical protein